MSLENIEIDGKGFKLCRRTQGCAESDVDAIYQPVRAIQHVIGGVT
jgi:hypothetical protein